MEYLKSILEKVQLKSAALSKKCYRKMCKAVESATGKCYSEGNVGHIGRR